MKPIQRIVIAAEVLRKGRHPSNGLLEHATKRFTIHNAGMDSKSDDPAGVLIHHH
jgi:hypothetical protein